MRPAVKRRLVTLAAAASLVVCIYTAILWTRSSSRSAALALGAPATTQPATVPTTQEDERPGSLSGVVRHEDGRPAVDVRLALVPKGRYRLYLDRDGRVRSRGDPSSPALRTTTDAEGRFRFERVPPDLYWFQGGSKSVGWIYEQVHIVPSEEERINVKLELSP
jgi:hypothetical protein